MKPEVTLKYLSYLRNQKKQDEGFTLIELLVVVIIIGVLAAAALPALFGQVGKARVAEAKQNAGAVNRAQQAYFLEESTFGNTLALLEVTIPTSEWYSAPGFSAASTTVTTVTFNPIDAANDQTRVIEGTVTYDGSGSFAAGVTD